MKKPSFILLLAFGLGLSTACARTPITKCSSDWKITGYFTPVETDYPQQPRTSIRIRKGKRLSLPTEFIKNVRIEGWGKTVAGFYIGHYDGEWHTSRHPLDALGHKLRPGSIATDKRQIPHGSHVSIASLPNRRFTALDIGPTIKGKHIDVFCGEGRSAEQMTFQVTKENIQVCVTSSRFY